MRLHTYDYHSTTSRSDAKFLYTFSGLGPAGIGEAEVRWIMQSFNIALRYKIIAMNAVKTNNNTYYDTYGPGKIIAPSSFSQNP